ncbi:hypothetical protein CMUS01_08222 [Colletotrichum musicola]|uniref:Uncharacterized protein n=1 Tax=Colletotrichum musicola TaxID=2175873 RepID=A0A8H6KCV2_9PEZI|nr:hypothetical protein CMUS01_08222 [Colletotrichum musicola]
MAPIQVHSLSSLALAAAAAATAEATPYTEPVEKWVMSSTTDTGFLFKGFFIGVISGLCISSLFCCWLPCIHYLYRMPGEHLHDFTPSRRYRLRIEGGFRACVRRRVRIFFMGRERTPDAEQQANGTGGDGVLDQEDGGGASAQGRRQQQHDDAYMQPAIRPSPENRAGYNPYDASHHRYIRDEEDGDRREIAHTTDGNPRVALWTQRGIFFPAIPSM